jgi:hypothetical protein
MNLKIVLGILSVCVFGLILSCAVAKGPPLLIPRGSTSPISVPTQLAENIYSNDGECVKLDTKVATILGDHDYRVYLSGFVVLAQGSTPTHPTLEPDDSIQKMFLKKADNLTDDLKKQGTPFTAIVPGLEDLTQDGCDRVEIGKTNPKVFNIESQKVQVQTMSVGRGRSTQVSKPVNTSNGTITLVSSSRETWKIVVRTNIGRIDVDSYKFESLPDCNIKTPYLIKRSYVVQYGPILQRSGGMTVTLDFARNLVNYGLTNDKYLTAFVSNRKKLQPFSMQNAGIKQAVYDDIMHNLKNTNPGSCDIAAPAKP